MAEIYLAAANRLFKQTEPALRSDRRNPALPIYVTRMPAFARTDGIDYAGAQTLTASLKGLRVCAVEGEARGQGAAAVPALS